MGVLLAGEGSSSLLTGLSVCCRVGWRGEQRRGGAVKMRGHVTRTYRTDSAVCSLSVLLQPDAEINTPLRDWKHAKGHLETLASES